MINAYKITLRSNYSSHEDTIELPAASTLAVGMMAYNSSGDATQWTGAGDTVPIGLVVEINNNVAVILTKFVADAPANAAADIVAMVHGGLTCDGTYYSIADVAKMVTINSASDVYKCLYPLEAIVNTATAGRFYFNAFDTVATDGTATA